jgi:replicative DNA helicase
MTDKILEAEQALCACVMADASLYHLVTDIQSGDFVSMDWARVWDGLRKLAQQDRNIDGITLKSAMTGTPHEINSALARLNDTIANNDHVETYADIVRFSAVKRQVQNASHAMLREVDSAQNGEDLTSKWDSFSLGFRHGVKTGRTFKQMLEDNFERIESIVSDPGNHKAAMTTDLKSINQAIGGGFRPGELTILAGRPGMGKTLMACYILLHLARNGHRVGMFSLEMSEDSLTNRLSSIEGGIPHEALRDGKLNTTQWESYVAAMGRLHNLADNVMIDDTASVGPLYIKAKSHRWKNINGLDLIIVDSLNLMSQDERHDKLADAVDANAYKLRAIGKGLGVPVVLLHQLSRNVEKRSDKRPMLSDLREGGEQPADNVTMLYRDEYYNPDTTDMPGVLELICVKNRHGEQHRTALAWDTKRQLYVDALLREVNLGDGK